MSVVERDFLHILSNLGLGHAHSSPDLT